jgi:glycine betaine catabolism B
MEIVVKIISTQQVARNVKRFRLERPEDYNFVPGQATELSVNRDGYRDERRPFTFTSLTEDPYLEFTIKRYQDHHSVTDLLHQLEPGDEVILRDVWGAIEYKGPGYFIAGGAGITPFLAILRDLHKKKQLDGNILFFSNHEQPDIICEQELKEMLGDNAVFVLTRENKPGYINGRINKEFLQKHIKDISKHMYICGPDPMIAEIIGIVEKMGANADALVFEK